MFITRKEFNKYKEETEKKINNMEEEYYKYYLDKRIEIISKQLKGKLAYEITKEEYKGGFLNIITIISYKVRLLMNNKQIKEYNFTEKNKSKVYKEITNQIEKLGYKYLKKMDKLIQDIEAE